MLSLLSPRIGWFAREILGKPLYPYQETIGDAILDSVLTGSGRTYSVMLARQMGKNQLSAVLEAYLLCCMEQGSIVKAAPTFKPQIINSRQRLLSMLDNPLTGARTWRSYGYMVGVAATPELRAAQVGPRIFFFSAGPESNIVGATASLLLEIDEAQDVGCEKFDRDLRPMASTQNATTVLYGTAWSDDTLLAITRANNLALEQQDGIQRHFEHDWRTLAELNPHYNAFVEAEIERLGAEHLSIRTQYCLLPLSGAGLLLNDLQRYMLRGKHTWEPEPDGDGLYVIGMDVGGEERPKPGATGTDRSRQDSTVLTIGRVTYNAVLLPQIEIVHQIQWTGKGYLEQYAETVAIVERWGARTLVVDRTGLGEVMGSLLAAKLGPERVVQFRFSRPSKSHLTYQFLSMVNAGRLKMYQDDGAPPPLYEECWKQLKSARYRIPGEGILDMYVDPGEGHDDFLISVALLCEAVKEWSAPVHESYVIRPPRLYEGEGRY